jgi:hypothetical protein
MNKLDQLTAAAMIESTIGTLDGLSKNEEFSDEEQQTLEEARNIIQDVYDDDVTEE